MKRIVTLFLTFACLLGAVSLSAEPTPRWVKKGVKELDKERSNNTYSFHVFHTYDADEQMIYFNQFQPLIAYVDSTFNMAQGGVALDSIDNGGVVPVTYVLSFVKDNEPTTVYAQLVDTYQKFEDYADGFYEYNFWQLYAISEPNVVPQFDEFSLSRNYHGLPVAMSLVPGLGQIYKDQKAKGYTIMGTEAVMIAGIVYGTIDFHHYRKLARQAEADGHQVIPDSYRSRATTCQQLRLFCAITGAGVYVYNLLDAALCKGARYVEIKRKNQPSMELTFAPIVAPDAAGLGLSLKF